MAKLQKKTRVAREKKRLLKILEDLDENKLQALDAQLDAAAYIRVSLQDVQEIIDATGWVETYQNGENQIGVKKSAAADVQISLTKNLNATMKEILAIVPPAARKSKLEEFMAG